MMDRKEALRLADDILTNMLRDGDKRLFGTPGTPSFTTDYRAVGLKALGIRGALADEIQKQAEIAERNRDYYENLIPKLLESK